MGAGLRIDSRGRPVRYGDRPQCFRVGINPGRARILGVSLKLDFQRGYSSALPRSLRIRGVSGGLLYWCDEYHAFATLPSSQRLRGGCADAPLADEAGLAPLIENLRR